MARLLDGGAFTHLGSAHADEGADDGVGTSLLALAVVARLVTD